MSIVFNSSSLICPDRDTINCLHGGREDMLIFHMKEEQHVFTGFHFQSWHRGETRDVRRSFEEQSMHHCPSTVINEAGYTVCESKAQVMCTCPRDLSVKTDQPSTCILYFSVYTQPFIQKMSVYSQLKLACGVLTASRNTHCHRVLFLLFYRKRSNTVCVSMSVRLQMSLPIKLSRTCVCKDALTLFVLLYFWICLSTAIYFNMLQLWAHPSSPLCIAMWDNTSHQNTLKNPVFCIMHRRALQFNASV